jgi:phage gp36-like protein
MAYITQADLENALGVNVVLAIFDDNADGVVGAAPIAACVAYASAQVDAFLAGTYAITLPIASPPDVVKFAAVDFACAYAMRRRPDIVRAMSEKSWSDFHEAAVSNMKLYASALERLPVATGAPANVGGATVSMSSAVISANSDGTPNMGDF